MDCCNVRELINCTVQENGIIRNQHGYLIGRLVPDTLESQGVKFENVNEVGGKPTEKQVELKSM